MRVATALTILAMFLGSLTGSAAGQSDLPIHEQFEPAYDVTAIPRTFLIDRDPGHPVEINASLLRSFIEDGRTYAVAQSTVSTEGFDALLEAWNGAPADSVEEQRAAEALQAFVTETLGQSAVDIYIRYLEALPDSEEEANALGEVQGITIVDRTTNLSVPPEVWGLTSTGGSIGAFFPTIVPRKEDEIIRIEPRHSYSVVWKVDSWSSLQGSVRGG